MPELPEVQTIISQIRPHVRGKFVTGLRVLNGGHSLIGDETPYSLAKKLEQKRIIDLTRVGKFFILELDQGSIVGHLRMTGLLEYSPKSSYRKHSRLDLTFKDGGSMLFHDIRRFATFHFVEDYKSYPGLLRLGPDALSDEFNTQYLSNKLSSKSKNIYSSLMDQSIVAGLGNIYVNESLFLSNINPLRPSNQVAQDKYLCEKLVKNIKRILEIAINYKGTTLVDKTYQTAYGEYGQFYNQLKIYGRTEQPCIVCSTTIQKTKIGGRSVWFCPRCQK